MVFCNKGKNTDSLFLRSHNPYFNRWFSAICTLDDLNTQKFSHNPYFNRWFSAMLFWEVFVEFGACHNPYFNRWFSAIRFI